MHHARRIAALLLRAPLTLALTLTLAASPAAGDSPVPLQPAGSWTVRGTSNRCVLERSFGPAARPTTLSITPGTLGTAVGLRLVAPQGSDDQMVARVAGTVTLDPSSATGESASFPTTVRSYGPLANNNRLTAVLLRGATARDVVLAPVLVIERGRAGPPIVIAPGGSQDAVAALEVCETDLLHRLGIDPAPPRPLSRRPEPVGGSAARWFGAGDYPRATAGQLPFGHVVARIVVQPDGSVGDCVVAQGSGSSELDAKTCAVLRARGRYLPALDSGGVAVAAPVVVPVNWEPPRR